MDPPEAEDAGRLYRQAMQKDDVYGHEAMPMEYARAQTDTLGSTPWHHDWTRD